MKNKQLDAWESHDDLGLLDEIWTGWKLRRGQLFDPYSSATIGFRPEEIRALPYRLMLIAALQRQLRPRIDVNDHSADLVEFRRRASDKVGG